MKWGCNCSIVLLCLIEPARKRRNGLPGQSLEVGRGFWARLEVVKERRKKVDSVGISQRTSRSALGHSWPIYPLTRTCVKRIWRPVRETVCHCLMSEYRISAPALLLAERCGGWYSRLHKHKTFGVDGGHHWPRTPLAWNISFCLIKPVVLSDSHILLSGFPMSGGAMSHTSPILRLGVLSSSKL